MMKILKNASGPKSLKISRIDWFKIGRKAGWIKKAKEGFDVIDDDDSWGLDDSFDEPAGVISGIKYETTIDYSMETDVDVTIIYDYTKPGADTDWVPIVEITDILDKSGHSVMNFIYKTVPNFKIDIEQDLIAHGEKLIEENEEHDSMMPSGDDFEDSEIEDPRDIGTDYAFGNRFLYTDRDRVFE